MAKVQKNELSEEKKCFSIPKAEFTILIVYKKGCFLAALSLISLMQQLLQADRVLLLAVLIL